MDAGRVELYIDRYYMRNGETACEFLRGHAGPWMGDSGAGAEGDGGEGVGYVSPGSEIPGLFFFIDNYIKSKKRY